GHFLASHGIDHDPEAQEQYQKDYTANGTANVKKDFLDNLEAIKVLFAKKNDKSFKGFQLARLPGNGSFYKDPKTGGRVFVDMITKELKLAHAVWDFEFFPNGKFIKRKPRLNDWMGVKGVAAETLAHAAPKDNSIVLLHEHHWAGTDKSTDKGTLSQLKELFQKLTQETRVVPFIPLPKLHPKIQYP
ncbi:MAG TPA: hypothetical protein VEY88_20520, partial [Archangium sp.]|nr:hypothetical protein [Archangium sp.]